METPPSSAPDRAASTAHPTPEPSASRAPRLLLRGRPRLGADSDVDRSTPSAADLIARYLRLGERFLDEVRGEFVVVLEDPARGLVLAARDGMGAEYAAYRVDAAGMATARDDADLAQPGATGPELEPLRLAEFFGYQEISGPSTLFRGVRALLPGEMVIFERGAVRRRSLARPDPGRRLELPRWEEYVECFAELLSAAVVRSLAGTERAAVLMGGGLDSAPIAALAARALSAGNGPSPVTALCWRVSDPEGDESAFARATAAHCGLALEWIDGDDALPFSDLERWPVHPSTPEQTAYRWLHQRSYVRAAELGHRVLLTGFGGDSLYGHARRWAWDLLRAEGPGACLDRLRPIAAEIGVARTLRAHVLGPLLPRTRELRRHPPSYLTPSARDLILASPRWPPGVESARRPRQAERVLALLDGHGANVERFYTEPFGLEQRQPLRDFDLAQFVLAVPDHLLEQGGETRPVLRAATRGWIPEEVRLRRGKASFRAILQRGLAAGRLDWARELLTDPEALWRGFVEESAVSGWLRETPADEEGRLGLFSVLFGELWRRRRPAAGR